MESAEAGTVTASQPSLPHLGLRPSLPHTGADVESTPSEVPTCQSAPHTLLPWNPTALQLCCVVKVDTNKNDSIRKSLTQGDLYIYIVFNR